jgi:phosphomannomutase
MQINPNIFKAYDIRGIYPTDLNEDIIYKIGRAIATYTKAKTIVVGKDCRLSSDSLADKLIAGITDQGTDVINIGLSSTPMLYFASGKLDVDAGVIITASHNPAEWNGLKLCWKNAVPIGENAGMEEIRDLSLQGVFNEPVKKGITIIDDDLRQIYLDYIADFFNTKAATKKKIVIDFANAMGINDKSIYEKYSDYLDCTFLYDNFDGLFPNHEANPLKLETLNDLQRKVTETNSDLGMAYDGDADRIGFVDELGQIVPMDFITALIAKEILKKHPGGLILADLRSSNAVTEYIKENGGQVGLCRVGHSLIKRQMREQGAIFAGELSGHYYFDENFKAEMSTLAALMIINLLNESGKKMSELTGDLKRYFHSGEINSDVVDKSAMMEKLKKIYADGKLNELDGIRIDFDDWWFNVRPSNTEPKLRLNLEAKTKELMEAKRDEVLKIIRE